MPNVISRLFERAYSNSTWDLSGQAVTLERPDRLSFKEGMTRIHWLTVKSDGTLKGGIRIDIGTMNATNPMSLDEPRDVRIERACRVHAFLSRKGFTCDILEDGRTLSDVCVKT